MKVKTVRIKKATVLPQWLAARSFLQAEALFTKRATQLSSSNMKPIQAL